MSSRRIVSSCAFMAAIVAAGSWYAVSAFPLQQQHSMTFVPAPQGAPGPLELRAQAITPENPIPRRLTSENMLYPSEAAAVQAGGKMTLQITLDELGRVAEARPTHFSITSPAMDVHTASFSAGTQFVHTASSSAGTQDIRSMLERTTLRGSGKPAPMLEVYDAIVRAATDAARQWRYDPPFKAPISFPVTFRFGPEPAPIEVGTQVIPARSASNDGAIRVGEGGITAPKKITHVPPVYPAVAQAANVQGVVIMEARIEPDGSVSDAKAIKSIPLLDQAAIDAVKQWRFTPTLMNGVPVAVVMTVTINFTLGDGSTPSPEPPRDASAGGTGLEPYWSPDRSKVAFLTKRGDGKIDIAVLNRDGSSTSKAPYRPDQK